MSDSRIANSLNFINILVDKQPLVKVSSFKADFQ